jgi:hypothetical protein
MFLFAFCFLSWQLKISNFQLQEPLHLKRAARRSCAQARTTVMPAPFVKALLLCPSSIAMLYSQKESQQIVPFFDTKKEGSVTFFTLGFRKTQIHTYGQPSVCEARNFLSFSL